MLSRAFFCQNQGLSFSDRLTDELVDIGRDDSPDTEVFAPCHVDGLESRIGGHEPCGAVLPKAELLDGEVVTVVGDGEFEYDGQKYTSLSRIAKVITGGHWNGKLFFGVK